MFYLNEKYIPGLFQSENQEFDSEKSNAVLDSGVNLAETEVMLDFM